MADVAVGVFSYNGHLAKAHRLSARDLGPSLVGLDAIVSSLLRMLETQTVQRKKPRDSSLLLTVSEPREGSFELPWIAQVAPGLLPLLPHFTDAIQASLVEHFVNYVMLWFGGRRREANIEMDRMIDLLEASQKRSYDDRQAEREAFYTDRQRERDNIHQLLHGQALALHGQAKLAVTPIGRSASSFSTHRADLGDNPLVDEATADAIRAKEELIVSDVLTMEFRVEGLRDQRRLMYVYDPEDAEGIRVFPVVIADPEFDQMRNPYKRSYADGLKIALTGKTTRTIDGPIKTFHAISAIVVEP
ncbi:MAG: hypothetical protein ACK4IA_16345 [Paracoccus hibiscisoli]|uniref:DUF7946 domain-containing protein n=1 Tax=Paracoccus hibiscisoli TaxID=2023261 RepID=UPI00391D0FBD